jgi:transcriptional regulator with XRE-family HTH domain
MNVLRVGEFIRTQRRTAKLSLSKVSGLAGVSIPYLSQVERGLRKPSADVLQAIAKGLRISAETMYVQAGILEDRAVPDVATTILADPSITERQKQALVQIYEAFRDETGRIAEAQEAVVSAASSSQASKPRRSTRKSATKSQGARRSTRSPRTRGATA